MAWPTDLVRPRLAPLVAVHSRGRRMTAGAALGIAALLAALLAAPLHAQQGRGSISGTVSDASGAAVPDATVTVTNVATQATFVARTNNTGFYTAPSLPVGEYAVTAEKTGFKTAVSTGIVLQVDEGARVDFKVELGDLTERVEVRGSAPLVNTSSATVGKVIENRRITELPLNGRNAFALMALVPSVKSNSGPTQSGFSDRGVALSAISINGGPTGINQYILDGATNNQSYLADINVAPAVDAVEEFKVQTSSMSSEFGFTAGGVVNMVTKSGTNQFRGSAYDFTRNDRFDARNAFATAKPEFSYNQGGGAIGGPIKLPGYDGANRSFFFFNFEGWNFSREQPTTQTVPTAAMRRGDFSNLRDANGNLIVIYDPNTTRANPNGAGFVRDPFPNNIIPSNRLDPVAQNILPFYPDANRDPENPFTNSNNWRDNLDEKRDMRQWTTKVDHRFSSSNSMSVRYNYYRHYADGGFSQSPWPDPVVRKRYDTLTTHNFVVSNTHTFGGDLLNEVRVSNARQGFPFVVASFGGDWPAKLGLPSSVPDETFPIINNGLAPFNSGTAGLRESSTWQMFDMMTLIKGRQTFKFGADVRHQQALNLQRTQPSGAFTFPAGLTGNPQNQAGTGNGFATFMLGAVGSASATSHLPEDHTAYSVSGFFQDDWKLGRLTLNLGLRYDYQAPPKERDCATSNFNPFVTNPQNGLLGRMEFACADYGGTFLEADTNDFGPRVGFAYDLFGGGRTVLRGGYGLFYATNFHRDYFGATNGFANTSTTYNPPGGNTNLVAFRLQDGFPTPVTQPLGAALGPSAFLGGSVSYDEANGKNIESHQWTLSLQQQVLGNVLLEMAYSANRSTHLISGGYDFNQLDPQDLYSLGLALQDQVPNPYAGRVPGAFGGATISRLQSLRPYPYFSAVTVRDPHQGFSEYHSLLLSAERRLVNGFVLLGSYTFATLRSDSIMVPINFGPIEQVTTVGYQDGKFSRRGERSLDPTDVRHRLVVSGVYELPFGTGKRWLTNGVGSHIAGGWQINSITTWQGGVPLIIRGANNFRADRPNYLGDAALENPTRDRWFNTDAFVNPPNFQLGDAGRTLDDARTPGVFNVDLSILKQVTLRGRMKLQLRAEAFNVTNHVNLGIPNTTFQPGSDGRNTNSNFGRITASRDARILQFGARLVF